MSYQRNVRVGGRGRALGLAQIGEAAPAAAVRTAARVLELEERAATAVRLVSRPLPPRAPPPERLVVVEFQTSGCRVCRSGLGVVEDQAAEYDAEGDEVEPVWRHVLDEEGEEECVHVGGQEGQVKHRRVPCLEEERRPAVHHRQTVVAISRRSSR